MKKDKLNIKKQKIQERKKAVNNLMEKIKKKYELKDIAKQETKSLNTLIINEAVLRKMFSDYDVFDKGIVTGKELLKWINESSLHRSKLLNLPKLKTSTRILKSIDKDNSTDVSTTAGSKKDKKENKNITNELSIRVLWALSFGMKTPPDYIDNELKELGNDLSFRSFLSWVREIVNLSNYEKELLIKRATEHSIGGKYIEEQHREREEKDRKKDVAAFLGLSFVDTIVRLACRGPIDNNIPVVDYECLKYVYQLYGKVYQFSDNKKIIKINNIKSLIYIVQS